MAGCREIPTSTPGACTACSASSHQAIPLARRQIKPCMYLRMPMLAWPWQVLCPTLTLLTVRPGPRLRRGTALPEPSAALPVAGSFRTPHALPYAIRVWILLECSRRPRHLRKLPRKEAGKPPRRPSAYLTRVRPASAHIRKSSSSLLPSSPRM